MTLRAFPNKIIKRSFDLIFSLTIIIFILSWMIPLVAVIIKLSSRGPVFFKQKRLGLDSKIFLCFKFRSMYLNHESDIKPATASDERITRIGKFLRKSHLDEFPQFFNVLLGDMSVVGPRPHMLQQSSEYSRILEKYILRYRAKPGVTGLAQLTDFRNDIPYHALMRKRNKLDILYIRKWSFGLDLHIILLTVLKLLKRK